MGVRRHVAWPTEESHSAAEDVGVHNPFEEQDVGGSPGAATSSLCRYKEAALLDGPRGHSLAAPGDAEAGVQNGRWGIDISREG